jgi:hypothetical protein
MNKFKRTYCLLEVPMHTGIFIHPANYPGSLSGCIAAGENNYKGALDNTAPYCNLIDALAQFSGNLVVDIIDARPDKIKTPSL